MKRRFLGIMCVLLILSSSIISWKTDPTKKIKKTTARYIRYSPKKYFTKYLDEIYNIAQLQGAGLEFDIFQKAVTGFFNLKATNKAPQYSSILTIVDFSKSSCIKRMWVIDLINKELLFNTWVAHGNASGNDIPNYFSNSTQSHASSLGLYIANEEYNGRNGRSLRLDGMDSGFNDNARSRAIVVHAASYVSQDAINSWGRLGRSEGCLAVSPTVVDQVINTLQGKTVLFISGNDNNYTSQYLDENIAANYVYPSRNNNSLNASL